MQNDGNRYLTPARLLVLPIVRNIDDQAGLDELRSLLVAFNHERMQSHLDKTLSNKDYSEADFHRMLQRHNRKISTI